MRICLDPGHGGSDPGATGPGGTHEADVMLQLGWLLAERLQSHELILTHRHDTPDRRATQANQAGADLYISLHANGSEDPAANGAEVYYYAGSVAGSYLADDIQSRLVGMGYRDRGVKIASFAVLRLTAMPAVLVEFGFVTNPAEEELLRTHAWLDRCAQELTEAIWLHAKRQN